MKVIFSTRDAKACLSRISGISPETIEANLPQTHLALCTYFGVLEDIGIPFGLQLDLKHAILNGGLAAYVGECDTLVDGVFDGLARPGLPGVDHLWSSTYTGTGFQPIIARILDFICTEIAQDDTDAVRCVLEFLCYFDRFTMIGDTQTLGDVFGKFRTVNKRCGTFNKKECRWPGSAIRAALTEELEKIYTPADWHYDGVRCHFSSGTTADSDKPLVRKLRQLAGQVPYLYHYAYPLDGGWFGPTVVSAPRLIAVPKGFTSRRIIAPELTHYGFFSQGALEALRGMLRRNGSMAFINEKDQSANRGFAELGSKTDDWATIDMSSASDSISKSVFLACMPSPFVDMFLNYMSFFVRIPRGKGKGFDTVPLHMLYTSGNPLTWLTEATWFLALGRVGARLSGVTNWRSRVFAYGDDLIVPVSAYETTCEVLEAFGHIVNRRKSFGSGVFRESCGGWYYRGSWVTPVFWPRREVSKDTTDQLQCLCSLQHNFYTGGYKVAADVCAELARGLYPQITTSHPYSEYDDLWDETVDEYTSEKYRHTHFATEWEVAGQKLTQSDSANLEMYIYVTYLREGPLYRSKLDELLGTSISRFNPIEAYGKPRMVIRRS